MTRTCWAGLLLASCLSSGCGLYCDRYCDRRDDRCHRQSAPPVCAPAAGAYYAPTANPACCVPAQASYAPVPQHCQ